MTIENGDADTVARRVVELEKPTLAALASERKRSDWIKILLGSILTIVGIWTTTALDIGGYRENMKTLNSLVHQHLDTYTPGKALQLTDLEKKVAVNTQIIADIKVDLDDIKRNQAEMLKLLMRSNNNK